MLPDNVAFDIPIISKVDCNIKNENIRIFAQIKIVLRASFVCECIIEVYMYICMYYIQCNKLCYL